MKITHVVLAITTSLFIITTLFTSSCKREDNKTADPLPAEVVKFTSTSPAEGQTFAHGDTVWIKTELSYSKGLHGYEIKLMNESDNDSIVFDADAHGHSALLKVDTFWVNNVRKLCDMHLEIEAIKDHAGNKDKKEIHFHCHP